MSAAVGVPGAAGLELEGQGVCIIHVIVKSKGMCLILVI